MPACRATSGLSAHVSSVVEGPSRNPERPGPHLQTCRRFSPRGRGAPGCTVSWSPSPELLDCAFRSTHMHTCRRFSPRCGRSRVPHQSGCTESRMGRLVNLRHPSLVPIPLPRALPATQKVRGRSRGQPKASITETDVVFRHSSRESRHTLSRDWRSGKVARCAAGAVTQ